MGRENLTTTILADSSFPTFHPFRVSCLTSIHSPSSPVFPWQVTPTLGSTSHNSSKGYNKGLVCKPQPPIHSKSQMPGITWNSCCRPQPHGARKATHHMWGALIIRTQVQPTVCPCEIAGESPQGQLHPAQEVLLRTLITTSAPPYQPQAPCPPLQRGDFCHVHNPHTWSQKLYKVCCTLW